jgi:hypothetical protein
MALSVSIKLSRFSAQAFVRIFDARASETISRRATHASQKTLSPPMKFLPTAIVSQFDARAKRSAGR